MMLQALLFFVYGGFPYIYLDRSWPVVGVQPILRIVGLVLLFAGLGALFYGMVGLGLMRSLGGGEFRLVRSGVYRMTRNPQAIACGAYVIGFFVLWPSWYAAGWALLYFVLIHWMIGAEEDHLRRKYGQVYEDYCKRVPRYLGISPYLRRT